MFLSLMKLTRSFNVFLSKVVPSGFEGLARIKPLTLMPLSCACLYDSSSASLVILKLFELSQGTGIIRAPVRQHKSRLNLS